MAMKELDLNQLEGISGGGFADCTPETQKFIKAVVMSYKEQGFTRSKFIGELMKRRVSVENFKLYVECWDSM